MAKRFALPLFGVLCLMLSALIGFHLGAKDVDAQVSDIQAGYRIVNYGNDVLHFVMTSPGDVYVRRSSSGGWAETEPFYLGNYFGSGPVPTSPNTWGGVKGKYEGK